MNLLDHLALVLRPPGCGIPTLITGAHHAAPLLQALYGSHEQGQVTLAWRAGLAEIAEARCVLLGIPSDTGAGLLRGSAFGPLGIRLAYRRDFGVLPAGVVDVGDVLCIPHLLHDDMLSPQQLAACRANLYPDQLEPLPVSPLSVAAAAVGLIGRLNPQAQIAMLGGDHGNTWPMLSALVQIHPDLAVLQIDAHTDIAAHRFGIPHCFSTWAWHALKILRPHRLAQVGIQNSRKSKAEWMQLHPLLQYRSEEVAADPHAVIQGVVTYFRNHGAQRLYITNDIDGTDPQYAPATGTPEPRGLKPEFVGELIQAVGSEFSVIGGDIMEVAPPLSGTRDYASEPTCRLAGNYLDLLLQHSKQF